MCINSPFPEHYSCFWDSIYRFNLCQTHSYQNLPRFKVFEDGYDINFEMIEKVWEKVWEKEKLLESRFFLISVTMSPKWFLLGGSVVRCRTSDLKVLGSKSNGAMLFIMGCS